jgi:periplasmic protein TonB
MNHRFTVPVAVAVAVHALLLFGFRHTPVTPPVKSPPAKTDHPRLPQVPEEIELVYVPRQLVPKGSPDAPRPEPEVIVHSFTPPEFPIDRRPPGPTPLDSKPSVAWEPPGVPEGHIHRGIIPVFALDNPPNARVRIPPDYPHPAKQAGLEGQVMVEFSVDETGRVFNPSVINSTDRVFEDATVRAVTKWRFEPGKRGGRAVKFRMAVPVVFRLSDN